MITAQEAKKLAFDGNNSRLLDFFQWVSKESKIHHTTQGNFSLPSGNDFTEAEIEWIRNLGYSIWYNDCCLWYEVDWS